MENEEKSDCARFERLMHGQQPMTDGIADFLAGHMASCEKHGYLAVERLFGWPPGTLKNWNGRDPLPGFPIDLNNIPKAKVK